MSSSFVNCDRNFFKDWPKRPFQYLTGKRDLKNQSFVDDVFKMGKTGPLFVYFLFIFCSLHKTNIAEI